MLISLFFSVLLLGHIDPALLLNPLQPVLHLISGFLGMSSPFCSSSPRRRFEIVLPGGTLYVNAHFLAEMSPYFDQLCFDENFAEARDGRVKLDMDFNEVLAMLEYVCPDRNYDLCRKISDTNLPALIHCSHRFQIPSLIRDVRNFVEVEIDKPDCHLKAETLVDALIEAQLAGFTSFSTRGIYRKLAGHGEQSVRDALKGLPTEMAEKMMQETQHYLRVLEPMRVCGQSSYHWNDYSKRMFF